MRTAEMQAEIEIVGRHAYGLTDYGDAVLHQHHIHRVTPLRSVTPEAGALSAARRTGTSRLWQPTLARAMYA